MKKYFKVFIASTFLIFMLLMAAGCGAEDFVGVGTWNAYDQNNTVVQVIIEKGQNGYTIKKTTGSYSMTKGGTLLGNGDKEYTWKNQEQQANGSVKNGKLIVNGNEQDFYNINNGNLVYQSLTFTKDTGKEFEEMKKKAADVIADKEKKLSPKNNINFID